MQTAGTDLGSLAAEARAPQAVSDLIPGEAQASTDAAETQTNSADPAGEQVARPETVQVALAVCQQVAGGDLALAAVVEPPVVEVLAAPQTFEDEFQDFDLSPSTLVRLSVKRALDVVASGLALLVLMPLFLVIAAAIKLTDG